MFELNLTLFYAFAAILVFAAIRVITAKNPVHAVLYLVLSFFSAASIWILLQAEFLAITLVLVYVGAVMVLFLFVVMMIDFDLEKIRQGFWANLRVAAPVGGLIIFEMAAVLIRSFNVPQSAVAPLPAGYDNTRALGRLIYTEYVYAFQIAAVILLVAIVAAISLTLRRRKDSKHQNPSDQVRVSAKDRVRLVSMPSVSRTTPADDATPKEGG
ncbi:MAG: NADH-quinone oxidoreductase subunit J [Betaproteobacteria bacterium]|jgi:NADH-quinone oxidoreductase subunit J|nr:NADH-quinone oxidoreductase subunit J [Betaproteobacteria bacterium]